MKKKILVFLTTLLSICMLTFVATACLERDEHVHEYDKSVVSNNYLAQKATCEAKATYYYSCRCGEKGTATFEHGESLGHDFGEAVANNDGTHTRTCSRDSLHVVTEDCAGGTATCQEKAICDVCDTAYGDFAEHTAGEWVATETEHYQTCANGCEDKLNSGEHTFDEDGECPICGYVQEDVSSTVIFSDVFEVTEDALYLKLSNAETSFNFENTVEVAEDATFKIYQNDGTTQLTDLTVAINEGDNVFFITVTNGRREKTYEVTIRRRLVYTVEFNTNGGSSVESQSVEEDSLATEPRTTKTGYAFAGWDYDFTNPITSNTTINANWSINQYTLTFVLNNGQENLVITQDYNSDIDAMEDPTKEGYTFIGWDNQIPSKMPARNATINAEWEVNQYTLKIYLRNGQSDLVITQDYGTEIPVIEDPVRTGYTFLGWDKEMPSTMPAKNTEIGASWQINQYSITFRLHNGEPDFVITQDYNSQIRTDPPTPEREHATFLGWGKILLRVMPAENVTYDAQWDIHEYTLTIKLNNGQEDLVITQEYDTEIEAILDPERVGYKFLGWDSQIPSKMPGGDRTINATWKVNQYTLTIVYDNGQEDLVVTQDYNTDILANIGTPTKDHGTFLGWDKEIPSKMPAENLTITAQWEMEQYTLTIKLNNGEEDLVITQDYGTDIEAIADPEKVGHKFLGWDSRIPSKMPAQDLTINATWKVNQYTLTIVYDNGQEDLVITQDYDTDILASIQTPKMTGYTFLGWDKEIPSKMPAENLTITAQWEINQYTLVVVFGNGQEDLVLTQDYNTDIEAVLDPEMVGYTFTGWDKEIPNKMPAQDLTITAQWQINQYAIIIKLNDGQEDLVLTQDYNSDVIIVDPIREGYTFTGWDTEIPSKMPDHDFTISASWSINQYTLVVIFGNGQEDIVLTQDYGTDIVVVPDPEMVGYTFTGWDKEIPSKMPAENLTITAQWQINQYTLTIKLNNGEEDLLITQDYGSDIEAISDPEREGYKFVGWDRQIPSKMPNYNVTVIATWKLKEYSIIFNFDNGQENLVIKQEYTSDVLISVEHPQKVGHVFAGWDKRLPSIMPAEDVIITALWDVAEEMSNFTFIYDYVSFVITGVIDKSVTNVVVPDYITGIATGAFAECTMLTKIKLSSNLTEIGDETFKDCHRLMSEIIPDNVTSVGSQAFYNCRSLAVITVGSSVGTIGEDAFALCDKIIEIYNKSSLNIKPGYTSNGKIAQKALNVYTPSSGASNISEDANNCIIYTKDTGRIVVAYVGDSSEVVVAEGVTELYKYAFRDCNNITSITIPNSVTKIGDLAIEHCANLKTLVIGNGVTSLQVGLLKGCGKLQSLTIPFLGDGEDADWGRKDSTFGAIFGEEEYEGGEPTAFISNSNFKLYIPRSLKYVKVTGGTLTRGAFYDCKYLETVILPDDLVKVGDSAFKNCTSLTTVVMPSASIIGESAFENCVNLVNIDLPSNTTELSRYAFRSCSSLREITISEGITVIPSLAFYDCVNLKSITFNENLTSIEGGAFANCRRLEWVVIPDSVTTIGSQAFNGCDTLISITIGESVTEIGTTAFFFSSKMIEVYNKSSLVFEIGSEDHGAIGYYVKNIYTPTSGASKLSVDENGIVVYTDGEEKTFVAYNGTSTTLIMPNDITRMHQQALMYRDDLVSVTLSNNLKFIGREAFRDCSSIKHLIIPNSVTTMETGVFRNCSGLQTLVIGTGVQHIYGGVLEGCSSLQSLTLPFVGYTIGVNGSSAMFGHIFGSAKYEGSMSVEQYWNESDSYTFEIPASLTHVTITGGEVKYGAFYNCSNLTNVSLSRITNVGDYAFYNCFALKSVEIVDCIANIGERAFANCKKLTSVTLSDGIQSIADYAFAGCDGLKEVIYNGDIDSWVEIEFGTEANPLFNYSAGLYINGQLVTDVTINAETIAKNAFSNYKKLGNVTIGANVKSINEGAFSMSGVKSVVFAAGSTCHSIGAYAFWGCEELVSVSFADRSNNLTNIGDYAFQYCTSLTSIYLPYSLTGIGIQAFGECTNLTDVEFGRLTGWKLKVKPTWSATISVSVGDITDRPAELLTTTYVNHYWVYEG